MASDKACLRSIEWSEGLNIQNISVKEKADFPEAFPHERNEHRMAPLNPVSVYTRFRGAWRARLLRLSGRAKGSLLPISLLLLLGVGSNDADVVTSFLDEADLWLGLAGYRIRPAVVNRAFGLTSRPPQRCTKRLSVGIPQLVCRSANQSRESTVSY